MSIVQWLLLILVILLVAGVYWYLRRQSDSDPWRDMEAPDDPDAGIDERESLDGESYIVGVRTLSREAQGLHQGEIDGDPSRDGGVPDATAEASWQAYKQSVRDTHPLPDEADARDAAQAPRASERLEMRPQRPPEGEHEIFILHVASPDGRFFDGPDIHAVLAAQGLKFGLNDIYHRVTETHGVAESVFAVANMLKPGTLDPVDQDHLATPGLTLFLVVPGPLDGMRAMRDMMETANAIADAVGGEVLDDKRARLKAQTAQYMLDQIVELDRRVELARRR